MSFTIYIVNAFSSGPFTGNPAAVCPLTQWPAEEQLRSIAAQNNLSETAFFVKENDIYHIRWFTPSVEVALCGHATLAAAYIIFNELNYSRNEIRFHSKSGELKVIREKDIFVLNFPADTYKELPASDIYADALGLTPISVIVETRKSFILIEVATEKEVAEAKPDLYKLKKLDAAVGVILTAKGTTTDFVSRCFAPQAGIDEDPVTGSAHCLLIPYWAQKLNKDNLNARQLSKRGGVLYCTHAGSRVFIGGKAELYLKGNIFI